MSRKDLLLYYHMSFVFYNENWYYEILCFLSFPFIAVTYLSLLFQNLALKLEEIVLL
jgi:hypothetical protein